MVRLIVAVMLMAGVVGCASTKATFEVRVDNDTDRPISVGLVKEAAGVRPAAEMGWVAPEDIAIHAPELSRRAWGVVVPPGRSAVIGPQTGDFPLGLLASLRVYEGDHVIDELLLMSRGDPDRLDIDIMPGRSGYTIRIIGGRLTARQMR